MALAWVPVIWKMGGTQSRLEQNLDKKKRKHPPAIKSINMEDDAKF